MNLIHNLKRLASILEGEPDLCRESPLDKVDDLIDDLRKLVKGAEEKALTTAFYGQPTGVTLQQTEKK